MIGSIATIIIGVKIESTAVMVLGIISITLSDRNHKYVQRLEKVKTNKEAQMKKCTVCGKQVDPLNYGDLKIRAITKIEVLGENVKSKNTTLNLTLCKDCRTEISGEIVKRVLERKEVGCDGKCAECDGARI